jgi:putative glutamine amidotransferase
MVTMKLCLLFLPVILMMGAVLAAETRPVIGITMAIADGDATEPLTLSVRSTYVDAVVAGGGVPVLIPSVRSLELAGEYAGAVDGFIFVGGPDINPARYNQEPHPTATTIHPRREEFDFAMMDAALATGKPVLAICLGCQVLNVSQGGAIIQDIPDLVETDIKHRQSEPASQLTHDVTIVPGTKLSALLGANSIRVNSLHHQACVVTPESGLIVSATAPDGVVEAIELVDHPFAIGVQWHPEYLTHEEQHLKLFKALVEEARSTRVAAPQQ